MKYVDKYCLVFWVFYMFVKYGTVKTFLRPVDMIKSIT